MKILVGALILFGAAAQPAAAQDWDYSFAPTTDCLAEKGSTGEAHQCFGAAAEACMEANDAGYSTMGMVSCMDQEARDWDRRLNKVYGLLRAAYKASDTEMAEIGATVPSRADALRNMQRAWITFRDASCAYDRSHWGNGTGAGPAGVSCFLNMTARQAWSLEQDAQGWLEMNCNHEGC
ncbi:lysozyme inhibitor LprI family protein [Aliiroseovarius sp. PrR006]|uniref:lysozyme inhibitor LprI family protein n=1 Tax=Aliiroseovarius sp. PrR006 TaxID=2706883 RepID=UPI0013D6FC26|nr:lysozyme inhibitor LprI family protein [Aliiroseovarius sp. PrR006]NDW52591.1 DUF1311 domain-containing protein [Aliiroseovarius sp. PrR006]